MPPASAGATSFLQVASASRLRTTTDLKNFEVVSAVKALAARHHSAALAQLASRIDATIRYGSEAMFAVVQSTVPWATVLVRKMYGVAGAAHMAPGAHVLAWPSAEAGALPIEGGIAVAFRREIESAADPDAKRAELEAAFAGNRSPFPRAESFGVHDLIDPRETRSRLCRWIDRVWPLLAEQVPTRPPF